MIILDKKSYELLFYLLKLDEPETVMTISKKLNQSRRKIYYHLDKINDALPDGIPAIISYARVGILLTDEQKKACATLLDGLDDYSYVLGITERLQLIMIAIAVRQDKITIENLMHLTGVSRNTTLNDLNLVREQLNNNLLALDVNRSKGYYLTGPFLVKIRYLYRLLYEIYTSGNDNFIQLIQEKIFTTQTDCLYSTDILNFFQEELIFAKTKLGKTLNSQEGELMLHLLPYLLSCYRHAQLTTEEKKVALAEFYLARQRKEYQIAKDMATNLNIQFKVVLDDIEICLIATLLLSYRKDNDTHLESQDYQQMREDIDKFLSCFEDNYQMNFYHRQDLERQLLTHCKALIYRKVYGILSNNPLTEHIISKYTELFYRTKTCAKLLEDAWQLVLQDEDIAYLTIHLGGSLRKKQVENENVILVCDDGIGVQKLFLSQCQRYLKTSLIEAVFTSEQFASVADLLAGKVAITTVPIEDSPIPTLVVNPILTHDDIVRILRFVGQNRGLQQSDLSQELERQIRQYIKDDDTIYILRNKIEKLLHQELLSILVLGQEQP
ncbi:transcription antiterminator [Streptococcus sp. E17BB]|uniref:BglG family transcription antiterminator n=1 Tax=Streptococcus sp. E17BB TaxID=3278714 RepID=UPI00359D31C7